MSKSNIEWTERTWNPIVGCSIVSPGCTNCYAMKMAARIEAMSEAIYDAGKRTAPAQYCGTTKKVNGNAVWTGEVRFAGEDTLLQPLKRKKPTVYFVNSMGDMFHEDVPDAWIDRVFTIMAMSPQHTFQILTKRAKRMRDYCVKASRNTINGHIWSMLGTPYGSKIKHGGNWRVNWPLPNVWLGVSAERQQEFDDRWKHLRDTPAAVTFVSMEPLLGPILFRPAKPDWIIVGGESGPGARPMHPEWARDIRDQCRAARVSFFFKQWGEFTPCTAINVSMKHALCGAMGSAPTIERDWTRALDFLQKSKRATGTAILARVGKTRAGRLLDGKLHDAMPEHRAS